MFNLTKQLTSKYYSLELFERDLVLAVESLPPGLHAGIIDAGIEKLLPGKIRRSNIVIPGKADGVTVCGDEIIVCVTNLLTASELGLIVTEISRLAAVPEAMIKNLPSR